MTRHPRVAPLLSGIRWEQERPIRIHRPSSPLLDYLEYGTRLSEVGYMDAESLLFALSGDKGINPRAQQVIAGFINSSGTIVAFF